MLEKLGIHRNVKNSFKVLSTAFAKFEPQRMGLAWTGGKDSTLLLWLVRSYCIKKNQQLPRIFFIDEGDVFPEINEFTRFLKKSWNLEVEWVQNRDVLKHVKKIGDTVNVAKLSAANQKEIRRLGLTTSKFPFEPESFIGNHLMKTVALNNYIKRRKLDAVITGIRRDEHAARADETYFSKREDPNHTRVHPILHFSESDVWRAIHAFHIPIVNLYEKGYRSLGAASTTTRGGDAPAWKQDLGRTKERGGRRQDKEHIMEKLRKLGYM